MRTERIELLDEEIEAALEIDVLDAMDTELPPSRDEEADCDEEKTGPSDDKLGVSAVGKEELI